jgi:hypothetical protein
VGDHTLSFKFVAGWTKPVDEIVAISEGQVTQAIRSYTRQTGSLQVTLEPSGARAAGGQWSIDNGTTWYESGAVLSGLPTGLYTLKCHELFGWTTPADDEVTVSNGQTTTRTLTYVQQFGSLAVTLDPVGARVAGAKWYVDGGDPHDSGAVVQGLALGAHTVSFKDVAGWTAPSTQEVTVSTNTTTTLSATYVEQTGSLKMTIEPEGLADAGWRIDGGPWMQSGEAIEGIPIGTTVVYFKEVTGWTKPANLSLAIEWNVTREFTASYTQITGSLQVTVEPKEAHTAGAQWRVDGGDPYVSGDTALAPVGVHTVSFVDTAGWAKPADVNVVVYANETTSFTGTYTRTPTTGSLQVTIEPEEARAAGAQWRVDGGGWRNSGDTPTGLATGTHTVSFLTVSGWDAPADQSVTIHASQTTSATGTYEIAGGCHGASGKAGSRGDALLMALGVGMLVGAGRLTTVRRRSRSA